MKTDIKGYLEALKETSSLDERARQLWNIIYLEDEMEFARDVAENIVRRNELICDMVNLLDKNELESFGNLIKGITKWSADWFYRDGYGNYEDLTDEKVNMIIDDILNNLPEPEYWLVMNRDGDVACKEVPYEKAHEIMKKKHAEEPNAGWVVQQMLSPKEMLLKKYQKALELAQNTEKLKCHILQIQSKMADLKSRWYEITATDIVWVDYFLQNNKEDK